MIFIDEIYKNKKNKEQFVFTINTDDNKPAMIDDIRSSIKSNIFDKFFIKSKKFYDYR